MKKISGLKGFSFIVILLLNNIFAYSQVTIGSVEKPQAEQKVVLKPATYDSTKDFENQSQPTNYYQYIGLKVYLPPILDKECFDANTWFIGNPVGNKYYTIIDILLDKRKDSVLLWKSWFNKKVYDPNHICNFICTLKNDSSKDTIYSINSIGPFVLVPYFLKQKQLYEGKSLIWNASDQYTPAPHLKGNVNDIEGFSKWKCTKVTLLQDKQVDYDCDDGGLDVAGKCLCLNYHIYFILKNEKNETLIIPNSEFNSKYDKFISEESYNKTIEENKLKQDELISEQKKQDSINQENERKEQEKFNAELITKFGQHKGSLIAEGKVEIGMTTEMCKAAWGIPWDIEKTTTIIGTKEHWFYSWKYNLYFENDILVKIEN